MSIITIFKNQTAAKGDHTQHTDAYALIECDFYYDKYFMKCIGDDIYDAIKIIDAEKFGYYYTYDLII